MNILIIDSITFPNNVKVIFETNTVSRIGTTLETTHPWFGTSSLPPRNTVVKCFTPTVVDAESFAFPYTLVVECLYGMTCAATSRKTTPTC